MNPVPPVTKIFMVSVQRVAYRHPAGHYRRSKATCEPRGGRFAPVHRRQSPRSVFARSFPHYAWPGNVREWEHCVRNVVIRRDYTPSRSVAAASSADARLAEAFRAGSLTVDELVGKSCAIVYAKTGSYNATAATAKLDRRTVKTKIEAVRSKL